MEETNNLQSVIISTWLLHLFINNAVYKILILQNIILNTNLTYYCIIREK